MTPHHPDMILPVLQEILITLIEIKSTLTTFKPVVVEEVWLDNVDVRGLLHVSESTVYRRRTGGAWVCKKIGGKWYYLKSSLLGKGVM